MHIFFGDQHGSGLELRTLIEDRIKPTPQDKLYICGDLFDRAFHCDIVMDMIHKYNIISVMGNHERKLLRFIQNDDKNAPPHYKYVIEKLGKTTLEEYIAKLPILLNIDGVLLVHAGVNPKNPTKENISWNVYGSDPKRNNSTLIKIKEKLQKYEEITQEEDEILNNKVEWFDLYDGPNMVIYGHKSQKDGTPRIRKFSIGIDTSVCRGGANTAYCLETNSFITYKSGIDWFSEFKKKYYA